MNFLLAFLETKYVLVLVLTYFLSIIVFNSDTCLVSNCIVPKKNISFVVPCFLEHSNSTMSPTKNRKYLGNTGYFRKVSHSRMYCVELGQK